MRQRFSNLKQFVESKDWTEAQAAKYFGCSVSTISLVINRLRRPGGKLTVKMLKAGIDVGFHLDTLEDNHASL